MKNFRDLIEAKDTVVYAYGRFNPPTIGHEKLITKVAKISGSNPYRIYPSHSQNPKKDPLPQALKTAYMRKMFKRYAKNIIVSKSRNAIEIAVELYDQGYKNLIMVAGSDRVKVFDSMLNNYNGVEGKPHGYYKFDSIKVVSAGERDPDAEGVEGMSASKMRAAAVVGDYDSFSTGIPATLSDADKKKLYRDVRKYMGIREERDMGDMSDFETLRDAYLVGQIWNVGDIVEANDIRGEVIRKGANYLSYVDENNKVHKAWLHDIILEDITKRDLDQIEKYADKLFASVGIDVEFTRHFMDRVNDARNKKPITTSELVRLFKQSFKKYGKKIAKLGPDAEAVINDMKTNINMPFVLDLKGGELELIAKTVMRKKDFRTSGPKLAFEGVEEIKRLEKILKDLERKKKKTPGDGFTKMKIKELIADLKSKKENLELDERNYRKEYDNYQGRPEQIARRSSRNKARRVMGDKTKIGMDVGHKDNNPMNNDPENLRNENPSKNRREPRLREEPRIPRKKGQPAGSDKHSDLYTDENPKGTIQGLGFKDVETAKASVNKIKSSGKTHAHKIQAAIAMEQRAKEMGKTAEAAVYRSYIEMMKKKTKEMQKETPDTTDAMKRYKSGKAGFTDIAHLKAKGLIRRTDGTKRKSDKYEEVDLDELSSAIGWINRAAGRLDQIIHPKGYENIVKVYVDGMKDPEHRRNHSKWAVDLARRYRGVEGRDLILYINRLVDKGKLPKELKANYGVSESLVEEFEFFPKNVHERITLPEPPTNLQEEIIKLKQIIANRTPEDEESIRLHDENSFYAIEKYCESNNLIFHDTEMKDIVLQAKPTIGYFKNSFDVPRPYKVDSSIKPMSSVTSNTPAYPSGHACQSMLVALYVSSKFPEHEKGVKEAAEECGLGRVKGGFHYLADYVAGNILAEKMFLVMNRNDYGKQINEVKQDKDIKDREGTQPAKYYAKDTEGDTMSKSTKQARARHFDKKKKGPAPGDASATTKPSKFTKKFKQMYGEVKDHKTDYETFVKMYAPLNKAVDDASAKLKKITSKNKGAMGLTDPKVKASPEFKKAKAEYEKSFDLTKKFLKGVPKDFLRKNAQSRRLRREEVELDEKRAKKAVAGGKVQKLVTAHGYSFKGKNYKEIDMELVKIDNSSQMVTFNIIHPAEIFGNEMKIPFKNLRRGRYMATDTSKINNEVLGKDADMGDYIDDFAKSDSPQFKGKSKEKRKEMAIAAYLSKKESLLDNVNKMLSESGHTDVASMKNKVQIAMSALQKMQGELNKLGDEDDLPTWWTNKVATAVSRIDDMSDYLDTQVEEFELNEKIQGLVTKAKKSGMPYGILKKVYDRGMAAYKTGHRPGTTAQQWAFARVNSFVTKSSGTWGKADKDLAKQVRGESTETKTESLWDNIRKKKDRIAKGSGEKMRKKGDKGAPTPDQIKRASEEACCDDCDDLYDHVIVEAEYQGKKVKLNDPIRTSENPNKKFKVYTMGPSGKVVVVRFGDPKMGINRDDPEARKNFRARHNCDQKKDKTTAGYWSCYQWRAGSKVDN